MHRESKSEPSRFHSKNDRAYGDRASLRHTVTRDVLFQNEKKERKRKNRSGCQRIGEGAREVREKQKLRGYICFRHFLLLIPAVEAQRTSSEIPYGRGILPPFAAQFSLFLFHRQFTLHSLPIHASLQLTDQG